MRVCVGGKTRHDMGWNTCKRELVSVLSRGLKDEGGMGWEMERKVKVREGVKRGGLSTELCVVVSCSGQKGSLCRPLRHG